MHKVVMVVDDNETDLYVSEFVMRRNKFAEKVVCVESAMDALDYLRSHEATPDEIPELIFLDINMPVMSGFDFLDEYDKLSDVIKKHCIIMMLTTSLNEGDKIKAEENRYVRSFLNKPLTKEKIDHLDESIDNKEPK